MIEDATRTQRVIWGAMTLSQVLFGVTLVLALRADSTPPGPGAAALDLPLSLAAAAFAIAGSAYRRFAFSDPQLVKWGEQALGLAPEARLTRLLALGQVPLIVSLALHETVALLGFVLAFVHQEPSRYWPFLSAGLALNLLAFPRPARVLARIRELVPQLASLALLLVFLVGCSFRGGDFTPLAKEPETACSKEAQEICKEKLGSADIGNCVAREKYRCELLEQEGQTKGDSEPAPNP